MEPEKVRSWLEEMNLKFDEGKDILVIPYESTLIAVREVQWREGLSIVEIVATVVVDVPVVPPLAPPPSFQQPSYPYPVVCPNCRQQLSGYQAFCPRCGYDLRAYVAGRVG